MKKSLLLLAALPIIAFSSMQSCAPTTDKAAIVEIRTDLGKVKIKLYDATPKHTQNFLKLTKSEYYNGTIFHRVIKDFMIQGGDPDSKNPVADAHYGNGGPEYDIKAEFIDTLIHKKGTIAMARESDDVNPEKRSSGSQFYIVVGKVFTNNELDLLEKKINTNAYTQLHNELITEASSKLMDKGQTFDYAKVNQSIQDTLNTLWNSRKHFTFSPKQREMYTTVGGTPHLDGNYTVFGEVIEGLDIVEKISVTSTDNFDRPLNDIIMNIKVVNKGKYDLQ